MRTAVVLGGSGFVGSACVAALHAAGWVARAEPAPRIATAARSPRELASELVRHEATIDRLAKVLVGADVVINSGGMAISGAPDSDELFGANSLLPALASMAARRAGARRFVHLSSISVQGRMDPLDETMQHRPSSPYASSRALGERTLKGSEHDHAVILRLPGVHGSARSLTRQLMRVARSPLSSTAGSGDRPTPLALVDNVSTAVEFLAAYEGEVPKIVLQPSEGITAGRILELLGDRKPRRVPVRLAKSVTALLLQAGRRSPRAYTVARRLEVLWFGQDQKSSWLTEAGFVAPVGAEGWLAVRRALSSG